MASKPPTNRTRSSFRKSSGPHSRQDTTSLGSFSTYSYMGGEGEESFKPPEKKLSRLQILLLDYKQFKAARRIQTAVRGWLARLRYRRQRCAAIIIQRDWRRYSAQRKFYHLLEQRVQEAIDEHHRKAVVRIQAYWRGFLVREHIHDQYRMKQSQRMAAQDLMNCIAYKLHYLLRTYQIPGIYSMRNSHVLSKVENMLISISFKQDNNRSYMARVRREADLAENKKHFNASRFGTEIPYSGPNFSGICDPKCHKVYKEPNIDARMHMILRKYELEELAKEAKQKNEKCLPKEVQGIIKKTRIREPLDFCGDIVKSMRKWNIYAPDRFEMRRDIFKNPENVAKFLSEIESIQDFMSGRSSCYCKPVPQTCLMPESPPAN